MCQVFIFTRNDAELRVRVRGSHQTSDQVSSIRQATPKESLDSWEAITSRKCRIRAGDAQFVKARRFGHAVEPGAKILVHQKSGLA